MRQKLIDIVAINSNINRCNKIQRIELYVYQSLRKETNKQTKTYAPPQRSRFIPTLSTNFHINHFPLSSHFPIQLYSHSHHIHTQFHFPLITMANMLNKLKKAFLLKNSESPPLATASPVESPANSSPRSSSVTSFSRFSRSFSAKPSSSVSDIFLCVCFFSVCFENLVTDFPAKLLVFLFSCQSFLLSLIFFCFEFLCHFFVD